MNTLPRGFTTGEPIRWRRIPGLVLGEVQYVPGQRIHQETHSRARFLLVVRGGLVEADQRRAREGAATLYFQPAGEPQSFRATAAGATCLILEMDDGWLARAREQAPVLTHAASFRHGLVVHLAHRLYGSSGCVTKCRVWRSRAWRWACSPRRRAAWRARPATSCPAWLARARAFVEAHFADRVFLATVAAMVGVHPVHLARTFRKTYDTTFAGYVRELRVEYARSQLVSTAAPLGDIAAASGFYDQSHFCRSFKRATGLSPAEYRLAVRPGVATA